MRSLVVFGAAPGCFKRRTQIIARASWTSGAIANVSHRAGFDIALVALTADTGAATATHAVSTATRPRQLMRRLFAFLAPTPARCGASAGSRLLRSTAKQTQKAPPRVRRLDELRHAKGVRRDEVVLAAQPPEGLHLLVR